MQEATPKFNSDIASIRVLEDYSISIQISITVIFIAGLIIALYALWRWTSRGFSLKDFEIDETEIGIGTGKIRLRPNLTDRQIAYAIWVELSTRKIGLPIDFDDDVIVEIYDSWYNFFGVTRDLVKSIPVNKVRTKSTQQIIKLSIEVLNDGLRPHLTKWQARFRKWYDNQLVKESGDNILDPQEIQHQFPNFDALRADMETVNQRLILYREHMRRLVLTV